MTQLFVFDDLANLKETLHHEFFSAHAKRFPIANDAKVAKSAKCDLRDLLQPALMEINLLRGLERKQACIVWDTLRCRPMIFMSQNFSAKDTQDAGLVELVEVLMALSAIVAIPAPSAGEESGAPDPITIPL